jgi:DNA-damage-inducible protein D
LAKVGYERIEEIENPEIARNKHAQGFIQNRQAAHQGVTVAGNARHEFEKKSGRKVVSKEKKKLIKFEDAYEMKQLKEGLKKMENR